MTIKSKAIILSTSALIVLITSVIILQGYKSANIRFFRAVSRLEKVNHSVHELAIEILLNMNDVDSLKKHINKIPIITGQLQEISLNTTKALELVKLELSIIQIKRVVEQVISGKPVGNKPLLEQIPNEVAKITANVAALKLVSTQDMKVLQKVAEIKITALFALLAAYIAGTCFLLFEMVVKPLLTFGGQVEEIRKGNLSTINPPARKDEIWQLVTEFNQLTHKRKTAEERLKQEISQHKEALEKVNVLSGFLPICASCKQIRDDRGYWNQIETYIRDNSDVEFSHSICPECAEKLYPGVLKKDKLDMLFQKNK